MTEYVVQIERVTKAGKVGATLTYLYGSPLRVGDLVMCPATEFTGPFIGEVVALGRGSYDGSLRSLICRVAPDRARP